jgi:hypothetical protein
MVRACTIPILMLVVFIPPPALPFNEDEFCFAVSDIARRLNARKSKWLDRSTRYDGVAVDCAAKTLEVKRFVNADLDSMREGWRTRKERAWSHDFCSDERWRKAIHAGWAVVSIVTFRSEERLSFIAECERGETE